MQDFLLAFNFLSQHIHLAGWVFFMGLVWKISRFVSKLMNAADEAKAVAERTEKMDKTIETLATNHLPHLQESMNNIHDTLKGMRQDMLTVLLSKATKNE